MGAALARDSRDNRQLGAEYRLGLVFWRLGYRHRDINITLLH